MSGDSSSIPQWLLFFRNRIFDLDIDCVRGSQRVELEFIVDRERNYYNVAANGQLLGAKFSFEAFSRRRLPGDEKDSPTPLFVGTFNHTEGVSGNFTVRPQPDGELMTLGVYGAPPAFHMVKYNPHRIASPVELWGIPNWNVRFVDPYQCEPPVPKSVIRAGGNKPRHYSGYCTANDSSTDGRLPMPAVLISALIAYQLLLKPIYLDESG